MIERDEIKRKINLNMHANKLELHKGTMIANNYMTALHDVNKNLFFLINVIIIFTSHLQNVIRDDP